MTDYIELDALFQKSNISDEPQYEKVEYIQLADEQGGSYDGEVSFNTQMVEKSNVVLSESFFALPLRIWLDADKKIAVKNSILSLIHGVTITSSAGTPIANDSTGSTAALANLKLLIDSNTDFYDGNELMYFGKDEYIDPDVSRGKGGLPALKMSAVGGVQSSVTSQPANNDPFHNPALSSRVSVFETRSLNFVTTGFKQDGVTVSAGAGYRDFLAYIPLKFIHSFWAMMNFALPNISLRWTFRIAGLGGATSYMPFTTIAGIGHRTMGLPDAVTPLAPVAAAAPTKAEWDAAMATTLAPAVAAGAAPTFAITLGIADRAGQTCKPSMWIKTVYFAANEASQLSKWITEGFEKKVVYTVSQAYPYSQTNTLFNQQIATSVIRPTRIWVMPLATNTIKQPLNCFPAAIGPNLLTDFNIQLNGNNFYNSDFKNQYMLYREFKTQLISAGSASMCGTPISYDDFLQGMNPYVFDLSRNPTVKSNSPNTINITGHVKSIPTGNAVTGDVAAYDLYVIIERLVTCTLRVSAGGIVVLTKDGADHSD